MKRCTRCKQLKDEIGFHKNHTQKNGLQSRCKVCLAEIAKTRYDRNKQHVVEINRLSTYGLTPEDFQRLWAAQNGRCAICLRRLTSGRGCNIDHDHACCPGTTSCGQCVRGLLCGLCNWGLGQFHDDPDLLEAARDYLIIHRGTVH